MQEITEDILTRAGQGELQAFEILYKASSSFVYNVAYRVVGNREDAEEVTQEVFLILHRKLKDFRFESSFKTWVYRISANCAINMAKKQTKISNKTVPYEEYMEHPAMDGKVEQNIDKEHNDKLIKDLLGELNPDQKACVVLRNIEGLSYEDIAQSLNININTVRSRLKRAREKLLAVRKQVGYGQV